MTIQSLIRSSFIIIKNKILFWIISRMVKIKILEDNLNSFFPTSLKIVPTCRSWRIGSWIMGRQKTSIFSCITIKYSVTTGCWNEKLHKWISILFSQVLHRQNNFDMLILFQWWPNVCPNDNRTLYTRT